MRKNRMMRLASLMLVLTLLSTCVISGTFAKYTTADSGTDTARVAKWGFEATDEDIVLDDLFASSYANDASAVTVNAAVKDGEEEADNLIAPGTGNSVEFGFAYDTTSNGIAAPEVAYTFTVTADITGAGEDDVEMLDNNPNFYWTLEGPMVTDADGKFDTAGELIAAINALDGDDTAAGKEYAPNELPAFYSVTTGEGEQAVTANDGAVKYTVGWEWVFETADDPTTEDDEEAIQDAYDTAMGNADILDEITITISVDATQVD